MKKKKEETYTCKNCGKECREKAYSETLSIYQLCPQCYTKTFAVKK